MTESVSINAVGDVWFGDHPVCIGHGVNAIARKHGPDYLFDHVRYLFESGDINFCNLESILSDSGLKRWWLPSLEMRGFPACASGISGAGINLVNIANNHIMQHGLAAYYETIDVLESRGINIIGLDEKNRSRVFRCSSKGIDIASVGYSMHKEEYYKKGSVPYSLREEGEGIVSEIADLREGFDGFIVCSIHWGSEYVHYPTDQQINLAHKLIDSGVNLLLGHHPHVLQGFEEYNGGLVCYSLGNFIFDLWPAATKKSVMLRVEVDERSRMNYSFVPIVINEHYQPVVAEGGEMAEIIAELRDYSSDICVGCARAQRANSPEERERISNEFRFSQYRYFFNNLRRYPFLMVIQSILRTVFRRFTFR